MNSDDTTIGELRRMGDIYKEDSSPIDITRLPFEQKIQMIREGIFHEELLYPRITTALNDRITKRKDSNGKETV